MILLRDDLRTHTIPIIATGFVFVNMLIFLWQMFALSGSASEYVYRYYGFIPREFMLSVRLQWMLIPHNVMTGFTYMFLHGGFFHLTANMLCLWIFGKSVEDAFGHMKFVLFYILSGVVAAICHLSYDPSSAAPMIGASGAIAGVLGAYLILFPTARIEFFYTVKVPAVVLLTIWFFLQVYYSAVTNGIAWYAHIGGFIFGLLSAKLFGKKTRRKIGVKSGGKMKSAGSSR